MKKNRRKTRTRDSEHRRRKPGNDLEERPDPQDEEEPEGDDSRR